MPPINYLLLFLFLLVHTWNACLVLSTEESSLEYAGQSFMQELCSNSLTEYLGCHWKTGSIQRLGSKFWSGLSMFFTSPCVNPLHTFCAAPLTTLPCPFCMVCAKGVLWSNSGSFLPDTLPLSSLNSAFHTESSGSQKQSHMQSSKYVNPARTESSVLWAENTHQRY